MLPLLMDEAARVGLVLPPETDSTDSIEAFEHACRRRLAALEGGQDHAHAWNGVQSAIEAARQGNAEYTRAGLWEAVKVLNLHAWNWNLRAWARYTRARLRRPRGAHAPG